MTEQTAPPNPGGIPPPGISGADHPAHGGRSRRGQYLAALSVALALALFVYLTQSLAPQTSVASQRQLLATIAQLVGAIFAIVFTLTLVAAQLASRRNPRLIGEIFSLPTYTFMALFAATILTSIVAIPLVEINKLRIFDVLRFDRIWLSRISSSMVGLCVLMLIPYLQWLTGRLDPGALAQVLGGRVLRRIRRSSSTQSLSDLEEIHVIAQASFMDRDLPSFRAAVSQLGRLTQPLVQAEPLRSNERVKAAPISNAVFRRLHGLGLLTLNDPLFCPIVLEALGEAGQSLANEDAESKESVEPWLDHVSFIISHIGEAALKEGRSEEILRKCNYDLGRLGIVSVQSDPPFRVDGVVDHLESLGRACAARGWPVASQQAGRALYGIVKADLYVEPSPVLRKLDLKVLSALEYLHAAQNEAGMIESIALDDRMQRVARLAAGERREFTAAKALVSLRNLTLQDLNIGLTDHVSRNMTAIGKVALKGTEHESPRVSQVGLRSMTRLWPAIIASDHIGELRSALVPAMANCLRASAILGSRWESVLEQSGELVSQTQPNEGVNSLHDLEETFAVAMDGADAQTNSGLRAIEKVAFGIIGH